MPMDLAILLVRESAVPRNPLVYAPARAPNIDVEPGREPGVSKLPDVQGYGLLYVKKKKICSFFSHFRNSDSRTSNNP